MLVDAFKGCLFDGPKRLRGAFAAAAAAAAFGSGGQDVGARKGRVSIGGPTSNNAAGGGCAGSPVSSPLSSICGGNKEFKDSLEELVA
mmetsp:Transcript_39514/g.67239  ORF Transcript_39514/g.67239 Transcript_39514/m.67239 type:complete len:88 (-) Transcript_39514:661-924(-)